MSELWAKIKDYPEYLVSSYGRIQRIVPDYMGRTGMLKPITVKQKNGYQRIMLYPTRKMFFVHKLVMASFKGKPLSDKHQINHKNGIKNDNHLSNLEYCTAKENTVHAESTGLRNSKGSKNSRSKLKEKDIREIRKKYSLRDDTQSMLAQEYKVCESTINKIINLKIWKHI